LIEGWMRRFEIVVCVGMNAGGVEDFLLVV
jgi:hypothetical protein